MTAARDEQLAAQALERGDYAHAIRLLLPLAESNSEYALLTLGWIHEKGVTGPPNDQAARSYYELAASAGSAEAYYYLGWLFLRGGHEDEAQAAFERGAQLNNDSCKSALARLADNAKEKLVGKAIEAGAYDEAMSLLRPLAARNSKYALRTLGWIYETGAVGDPDHNAAQSYYEQAVAQGSPEASLDLGRIFLRQGKDAQARASFEAGAQAGDIECMAELGRMMVEGRGGDMDVPKGYQLLETAAARGEIFAERTLLALEERSARSLSEKLSVKKRIAALAIKGAKQSLGKSRSDKSP